jgi:hypothetical protein
MKRTNQARRQTRYNLLSQRSEASEAPPDPSDDAKKSAKVKPIPEEVGKDEEEEGDKEDADTAPAENPTASE